MYLFSEYQLPVGKSTLSGSLNLLSQLITESPSPIAQRTDLLSDDSPNPAALLAELTALAWRAPSATHPSAHTSAFNEEASVYCNFGWVQNNEIIVSHKLMKEN